VRPERRSRSWRLATLVVVVLVTGGLLVARAQRLPGGPEPIAWDRAACAHCRMLIGEPGFAAQLQLHDGRVLDFDDPGCLLRHLPDERADVHAIWFHHAHEDRWLRGEAVRFRLVRHSPMGWGLAAVDTSEPHDLDVAGASARVNPRPSEVRP
jgi:hypothetical protein